MKQVDIDALSRPTTRGKLPIHATKLAPGDIKQLGEDVQVWAVRVYGITPSSLRAKALELVAVCLFNGDQEIFISADQFAVQQLDEPNTPDPHKTAEKNKQAPVWRGVSLDQFTRVIYAHLPHVTKASRVLLVTFDSTKNYGCLDVHSLDSRLSFIPAGGDSFSIKFLDKKNKRNLEILDVSSFFPGQDLGVVAGNFEVAYYEFSEPKRPLENPIGVRSYLRAETQASWHVLAKLRKQMLDQWGVDPLVYTTASKAAARVYVAHYLKEKVGGVRKQIRMQALKSFWGGRIEAFRRGKQYGKIAVYDAVSLYANAAINLKFMPRDADWNTLTLETIKTCAGGICSVEFEFPEGELHPCLPVEAAGQMFYPRTGISHCTAHEVRYALTLGARVELLSGWGYDTGDTTLAKYSADMLAAKNKAEATGDQTRRTLYKLMLNSLYGKFAQKRVDWDLETMRKVCREFGYPDLHTLETVGNWQHMVAAETGEILEPEINIGSQWCPEWVTLINGYARFIESKAMRDFVALAGTTDSVIIADDVGPEFFIEGIKFKREFVGDEFSIIRARLYVLSAGGEVVKAALHGAPDVPGMAEKIMAWELAAPKKKQRAFTKSTGKAGRVTDKEAAVIEISALRVRQLRDGLMGGKMIGRRESRTYKVETSWDNKREVVADYSSPFDRVDSKIDEATGELIAEQVRRTAVQQ